MVFGIAHDRNLSATGNHHVPLWYVFRRVISAFGVNVRTDQANQVPYVWSVKYNHCVHVSEGSQNLGALVVGNTGPAIAFQGAYARVRINGHKKFPAQLLGRAQITHMPNMQQIKAAVGKHNLVALGAPLLHQAGQFA